MILQYISLSVTLNTWPRITDYHGNYRLTPTVETMVIVSPQVQVAPATMSIADCVKATAETVLQQQQQTEQESMLARTGYVFDEASGQYFHSESGYYYDPVSQ